MNNSLQLLKKYWTNKWILGAAIALLSAILAIFLSHLSQFENFELKTYDARFNLRGDMNTEADNICIVAIDDQSFLGLNRRWPFSRSLFAKAILNLAEAGAKLIILDIEFTEPDEKNRRGDLVLAAAIKRAGNVLLSGKLVTEYTSNDIFNSYLLPPISLLLDAGATWGLINILEDHDGFIRRYLLFVKREDQVYYPLSIQAFRYLQGNLNKKIKIEDEGYFVIGNRRIPKKDFNSMLINYRGPAKSFPTYSLSSILDDVDFELFGDEDTDIFEIHKLEGTFKDKIVLIGATAEELQDNKFTPFFEYKGIKRKMPGVEMHANALSTLLRGDFIVPQNAFLRLFLVLLLSFVSMLLTKWLKPFRGLLAVVGILVAYLIWSFYSFIHNLVWIHLTAPTTAIILSYFGNVVHQTLTEQRERIRIKKTWQHFMAKSVIDNMLESGEMPTFGGERRELTVLFSDIRGFTTYTERHASQEVVQRLNEYLSSMVEVIFKNEGTLDKFVGDEIMAIYGAPIPYKNHAEKACITALQMVSRLRELQRAWSHNNQDYFQIGIGVNSGKMIIGNLGSAQLFDYTVIGDEVNLGARLEGTNKQYGTTIIISEFTYKLVRRKVIVRELDLVRVKGKKKPVRIYELRGMGSIPRIEKELVIDVYHRGLKYYRERKWYQALTEFKRILEYFPTDGPTRVYIKRCLGFIENPPQESWDGVYEFTTK
jgi:adenylate cyclase